MQLAAAINLPEFTSPMAFSLAGSAVVVGLILLLWGRLVHRAVLLLAGTLAGYLCGACLAARINVNPLVTQIAVAVAAGVFALVAARLIWALLAASIFAAVPLTILVNRYLSTTSDGARSALSALQGAQGLHAFYDALYNAVIAYMRYVADKNQASSLLFVAVPFFLVLLVALFRPRLGAVFMTSVTGGLLLVAGLVLAGVTLKPSAWQGVWDRWYVPLAAAGVAAFIGLVFQYRGAIRSDHEHRREEAEPPDKGKTKSAETDE